MAKFQIGGAVVEVAKGDLTKSRAQAIVNPANDRMLMGGGVAAAIKQAGGQTIEEEAVRKGPVSVGQAVVTRAGALKAEYVIHAAVMGLDFRTDEAAIKAATVSTLKEAVRKGVRTLAMPAFGTGVGRVPFEVSGRVMMKEVGRFLDEHPGAFDRIEFDLTSDEGLTAFDRAGAAALEPEPD